MDKLFIFLLLYEGEMLEEFTPGEAGAYDMGHHAGQDLGLQQGAAGGLAAAAIAALVITASFKIYKRFLSKAARACNKFAGQSKTSCMNKYKRDALKAQVTELTKGKSKCSNTKDRAKCVQKIDKKIQGVKVKLGAL